VRLHRLQDGLQLEHDACKETGEGLRSDLIVQMQIKQTHVKKSPVFSDAQLPVNCLSVNAEENYAGVTLEIWVNRGRGWVNEDFYDLGQ
jgi:hypothetical protein